jgi:predicted Zn finger-like uncharacterized protein
MPENIQCPNCQRSLRVPDNLIGKKVKCPTCGTAFMAAVGTPELPAVPPVEAPVTPPPPAPPLRPPPPPFREVQDEDDYEELADRRPWRDEDDEERAYEEDEEQGANAGRDEQRRAWQRVRTGITLNIVSICTSFAGFAVLVIGTMALVIPAAMEAVKKPPAPGRPAGVPKIEPPPGLDTVVLVGGLIILAAIVINLVGYAFSAKAPPKHHARSLVIATLCFAVLSVVLSVGQQLLGVGLGGLVPPWIFQHVVAMVTLATYFLFLFFLMAVCRCLRASGVEKSIQFLTITAGITVAGYLLILVLIAFMAPQFQAAAAAAAAQPKGGAAPQLPPAVLGVGACVCGETVLFLVWCVWYLVALAQVRGVISRYLARA